MEASETTDLEFGQQGGPVQRPQGTLNAECHPEPTKNAARLISRRTFVALALGTAATLLGACDRSPATPTKGTPEEAAAQGASLTAPPAPTSTFVPPTATHTAAPPPSPTATPAATTSGATNPPPTASAAPPTYTPVPATPTQPPPPTSTPVPALDRAALMAHWPATGTSRVVMVRHSQVWAGATPDPAVVLQMLDEGLRTLTEAPDALAVWRALFGPGERVLLKVNCIASGGPTHPAVTYAVAQRLQDAGLPAENLLIFDRTDGELAGAGYTLNEGGPGVQCHGSRGKGTKAVLSQATVRFRQELDAYDALINLSIPKQHGTAGVSVSLKNHYGSVDNPGALHGNRCDPAIAELNAQPTIRDKTRLFVGVALTLSPDDWNRPDHDNVILLSFDPVALDTVARDLLVQHRQAQGLDAGLLVEGVRYLRTAQSLQLGATDASLIDLREVTLA